MDKKRYAETQKISGELWILYKDRVSTMPDNVTDGWWDKTVEIFNVESKKYRGTTHEKYVNKYIMACLEDLEEICKKKEGY